MTFARYSEPGWTLSDPRRIVTVLEINHNSPPSIVLEGWHSFLLPYKSIFLRGGDGGMQGVVKKRGEKIGLQEEVDDIWTP